MDDLAPRIGPRTTALAATALLLAALASGITLAWDGAFPPFPGEAFNAVLAEGRGWSAVTLLWAVPLGVVALAAAARGSLRGVLATAGVLGYLVYTYLEMAVSPPFTALYLVYVTTFATALCGLAGAVVSVPVEGLSERFARAPRAVVAGFGFTFAAFLGFAWLKGIFGRTLSGDFGYPEGAAAVGHVVHALDLGLQVPLGVATGVLLLRRDPAGWLVASLMLAMAACMAPALAAMVGTSLVTSGQPLSGDVPFLALAAWSIGLAAWVHASVGAPVSHRTEAGADVG